MARRRDLLQPARELGRLCALLVRIAGEAAVRQGLSLYLSIGIGAVILFGGNGMDAATVTRRAAEDSGFRWALLASWTLASLPTARAWLGTPATFFLRAQPVRSRAITLVLASGLLAVHLPWAVLWLRGAGLVAGLWAVAASSALQTLAIGGVRRWSDRAMLCVALAPAWAPPGSATALMAAVATVYFTRRAWSRAPEQALIGRGWVSRRGPLAAATTALAVALCRGHAPLLFRAALLALAAAWIASLGISHGAADGLGVTSLGLLLWVPAVSFGAAALASPLLVIERSLDWIARASGAPARIYFAPALLLAVLGTATGGGFALIVAAAAALDVGSGVALAAACSTAGAATAATASVLARRALRDDGRDAGRLVLSNLGSLSAWVVAITTLGARAVPLMALLSFGALALQRGWRTGGSRPCSP